MLEIGFTRVEFTYQVGKLILLNVQFEIKLVLRNEIHKKRFCCSLLIGNV